MEKDLDLLFIESLEVFRGEFIMFFYNGSFLNKSFMFLGSKVRTIPRYG